MDELQELIVEIGDRCRRTETRLTRYLTAIGFDTGGRRPVWVAGAIEIPSRSTSLLDCLSVIPDAWDREDDIAIMFGGEVMGYVLKP